MNNKEDKSLATLRPDLAKEWHPWRNGDLKPEDVTCGSSRKVWWFLPYKDERTGKIFEFEWQTYISHRVKGRGCPYLSNQKLLLGFNDLASVYPNIVEQWHPTKNGDLKPTDVVYGSDKMVWWYLPYDDPKTGKHFDFEWEATVSHRTEGRGCPYLSGKAVWLGYNDLETTHPELAAEWHPTRNGNLKPTDVTAGSNKKVWWYLPYDDPKTGKHFDFEWERKICSRTSGDGCPYLCGRFAWPGYNDLASTHPDLIKEWHPTKNGDLKPTDVTAGSEKKVWWYLPYDDPKTGKHHNFEWVATISGRTGGSGCPYLSGKAVWLEYNDLETTHPELAAEWHPTRNGNLKPTDVTAGSNKKVWWCIPYDDHNADEFFEWETTVVNRTRRDGHSCLIKKVIKKTNVGLNKNMVKVRHCDLTTTHPQLAKEWHPTKNGNLKPTDVTAGSEKKVWWYLPYDDPKTGKHFDFEWEARISSRTNGVCCPYLFNKKVWTGYNDLATTHPDLATEWHPTKNGDLKPTDVTAGSGLKIWWYLPYDDPKTGKHFDFEWEAVISNRAYYDNSCPYLCSQKVWHGYNDLTTIHPDIAKEWHPTKNGDLKPIDVMSVSGQKVWWYLPYDDPKTGKHFDFEWEASICARTSRNHGCPYLSNQKVWTGFNDLNTTHPKLAREWHPTRNGNLKPTDITAGCNKIVWWCLPYDDPKTGKHFDFEWEANVGSRSAGIGCPYLSNKKIYIGFNDLVTTHSEIAKEWHPTKNGDLKPTDVTAGCNKNVWWLLPYDDPNTGKHFDFEWETKIYNRALSGRGCPYLSESRLEKTICDITTKYKIKFETQKIFKDCLSPKNGILRYDAFFSDFKSLIEGDGIQHFKAIDYFGGRKEFIHRIKCDNIKNVYAFTNNKPLLRIPYIYVDDKDKIEMFIKYFLETGRIPQEIIDFYSQFEFSNYAEYAKNHNKKIKKTVTV